jgi:hypothetical protein
LGLCLDLVSKQKTELINIGAYSTTHKKYVNNFLLPIWIKISTNDRTHTGHGKFLRLYDFKNLSILKNSDPDFLNCFTNPYLEKQIASGPQSRHLDDISIKVSFILRVTWLL